MSTFKCYCRWSKNDNIFKQEQNRRVRRMWSCVY